MTDTPSPGGADAETLAEWVGWLVREYELWTRIPACWEDHLQVVNELQVLWALWAWTEETAVDPSLGATGRAGWADHLGRTLTRLAEGPNATCAKARTHRVAQTWDDDEFLARKAAQRTR